MVSPTRLISQKTRIRFIEKQLTYIIHKKPIFLSKPLLQLEIKRRNPNRKLNFNNKKVEDLFSIMKEEPINNADNFAYIQ